LVEVFGDKAFDAIVQLIAVYESLVSPSYL